MKKHFYILITLLILFALTAIAGGAAAAQSGEHHAGLVLQFADGTTQTYCIPFEGESISGLDTLLRTGLDVKVEAYGGMGAQVCKIGPTGCDYPGQVCACESFGSGGVYWSYHHLKDSRWKASIVGAGSYKVRDGEVEGWAYTDGKPPPLYSFSQLCPASAPQPTEQPTELPTQMLAQPTSTTVPPASTSTVQPQPATPTTAPTQKPAPNTPITVRPQPTATKQPTNRPTDEIAPPTPTTAQPQPLPTETQAPTETITTEPTATFTTEPTATYTAEPTPTITIKPTSTPTHTSEITTISTATLTSAPIPNPQSPIPNSESTARNIGIIIGGLVSGSLLVWAISTAIRRGRNGGPNNDVA